MEEPMQKAANQSFDPFNPSSDDTLPFWIIRASSCTDRQLLR
jgi:hypothetical protein